MGKMGSMGFLLSRKLITKGQVIQKNDLLLLTGGKF
jgi:hypothetical protein